MSDYITTAQAAILLNTTDRTIRRKVSALPPQFVRYVRKKGKTILIDIRLVYGNFERLTDALPGMEQEEPKAEQLPPPETDTTDTTDSPKTETKDSTAELLQILKEQLQEKDRQIRELQERNREQNIIIANMQQERQNLSIAPPERKRTFLQWLFRVKG